MFNAISDQLYLLGLIPEHQVSCQRVTIRTKTDRKSGDPSVTRKTAAQYMREHKDDFIAFLPSIGGEDTAAATEDGMMTDQGFEKYCRTVAETGEWGGEPEVGLRLRLLSYHPSVFFRAKKPDPSIVKSIQNSNSRNSAWSTNDRFSRRNG